jgi:hypothetical protein
MTDQELRDLVANLAVEQVETSRQIRELGKQLGGLGEKFGGFTEGMALPSMRKILEQRFGMEATSVRSRVRRNGHSMELDVLAYSHLRTDRVYIVEIKSHLREEGLRQMLRKLREFPEFFPEHAGKKVYGILAAVDVPDELRERVLKEGIYLAIIHDDEFEIRVPEGFQPRAF